MCRLAMEREGSLSLVGLSNEWDSEPSIRDRLRAGDPLISEVSDRTMDIKMVAKFKSVLLPIIARMAETPNHKLPGVDDLRDQIGAVLDMNKREVVESDVARWGWLIRKCLGCSKLKIRRQEVAVAPLLENER